VPFGLVEWVVLAVIAERPAHGFAIAALTAHEGELGRIWHVPRPLVYRALGRLEGEQLIVAEGSESGRGPRRTPYRCTPAGRRRLEAWLPTPVQHIRDVRSEFLLKLALHQRRGSDPGALIAGQREVVAPIAAALATERARSDGFDAVLLAWRESSAAAVLGFLDQIGPALPRPHVATRVVRAPADGR
jgi:PadR family transcriptional regulator AphA